MPDIINEFVFFFWDVMFDVVRSRFVEEVTLAVHFFQLCPA